MAWLTLLSVLFSKETSLELLQLGNATRVTNKTFRLDRNKILFNYCDLPFCKPLRGLSGGKNHCCKVLALAQLNQLTRFVFIAKDTDRWSLGWKSASKTTSSLAGIPINQTSIRLYCLLTKWLQSRQNESGTKPRCSYLCDSHCCVKVGNLSESCPPRTRCCGGFPRFLPVLCG